MGILTVQTAFELWQLGCNVSSTLHYYSIRAMAVRT